MKKKELKSLKQKTIKEIEKVLIKKRQSLLETIVKAKAGQEKNVKKVKMLKKDVAQILTILKQKQLKEKQEKKKIKLKNKKKNENI